MQKLSCVNMVPRRNPYYPLIVSEEGEGSKEFVRLECANGDTITVSDESEFYSLPGWYYCMRHTTPKVPAQEIPEYTRVAFISRENHQAIGETAAQTFGIIYTGGYPASTIWVGEIAPIYNAGENMNDMRKFRQHGRGIQLLFGSLAIEEGTWENGIQVGKITRHTLDKEGTIIDFKVEESNGQRFRGEVLRTTTQASGRNSFPTFANFPPILRSIMVAESRQYMGGRDIWKSRCIPSEVEEVERLEAKHRLMREQCLQRMIEKENSRYHYTDPVDPELAAAYPDFAFDYSKFGSLVVNPPLSPQLSTWGTATYEFQFPGVDPPAAPHLIPHAPRVAPIATSPDEPRPAPSVVSRIIPRAISRAVSGKDSNVKVSRCTDSESMEIRRSVANLTGIPELAIPGVLDSSFTAIDIDDVGKFLSSIEDDKKADKQEKRHIVMEEDDSDAGTRQDEVKIDPEIVKKKKEDAKLACKELLRLERREKEDRRLREKAKAEKERLKKEKEEAKKREELRIAAEAAAAAAAAVEKKKKKKKKAKPVVAEPPKELAIETTSVPIESKTDAVIPPPPPCPEIVIPVPAPDLNNTVLSEEKPQDDSKECPVCLDKKKDTAFECGHITCFECAKSLQICPICRAKIKKRIRLYY